MKDKTVKHFEIYKNLIENQLNINIKCLWSDKKDEYAETKFMNILKKAEIQWKSLTLYTPAQNRVTEYIYYSIFNTVQSIIIAMKFLKSL